MKTLISLILTAFIFVSTAPMAFAEQHNAAVAEQGYDCPMHPEVKGAKGDTCPKCGMNLEPVAHHVMAKHHGKDCDKCPHHQHAKADKVGGYECPMHPEMKGAKGDTCPKCGMNLEEAKTAKTGKSCDNCPKHKHQHDMAKQGYHCPMHPEVKGAKGDSCPKCGMFLEPVASADSGHKHH